MKPLGKAAIIPVITPSFGGVMRVVGFGSVRDPNWQSGQPTEVACCGRKTSP